MVDRISALEGHYNLGRFGSEGEVGITLTEVRDLNLHQVAVWPDTMGSAASQIMGLVEAEKVPGPCSSEKGASGSLLRVEPLKWWVFGPDEITLPEQEGVTLDLSHSRTHLRISGPQSAKLINRLLPLDLRDNSFPVGAVGSSALHHVGVTLWRTDDGYDLFVPRGFALAVWEIILETAGQFGAEVV